MVVNGSFWEAMDSLMYEVDCVSVMVTGKRDLIPIVKSLAKSENGRKEEDDGYGN